MSAPVLGLYLHIPFCEKKCHYCDFNTYAGMEALIPRYVAALSAEITRWGQALAGTGSPAAVKTIFFGGGTPSLLAPDQLGSILRTSRDAFAIMPDAEISMEANPGTVTASLFEGFRDAGINRLSMGAQSFHEDELQWLGRIHSAEEITLAYERAREAGLTNVNLDLIYGLPRQTLAQWEGSLARALELRPEHLSCYALTIEEGTPLGRWAAEGKVPLPDPDLAADMYEATEATLAAAGYEHYEISNWALPGRSCRHNLIYWENTPFVGCGAGAHSYLGGTRFADVRLPNNFLKAVANQADTPVPDVSYALTGGVLAEDELRRAGPITSVDPLTPGMDRSETVMLNLRLSKGMDPAVYAERFGRSLTEDYGAVIEECTGYGLLTWTDGRLCLTDRGRLLSNEVFVRLME